MNELEQFIIEEKEKLQVANGGITWGEFAVIVNERFGESYTENGIRKKYRRLIDSMEAQTSEFVTEDPVTNEKQVLDIAHDVVSEGAPPGYAIDTLTVNTKELASGGSVVQTWMRLVRDKSSAQLTPEKLQAMFDLVNLAPPLPRLEKSHSDIAELAVVCLTDIHVGKMLYHEDFSLRQQVEWLSEIVDDIILITAAKNPSRVLIPIGHDWLHSDTMSMTTTRGTRMDTTRPMREIVDAGIFLAQRLVKGIATEFPTDVIIVPGNHDELSDYWIGHVLRAYFEGQDIDVNISMPNDHLIPYRHRGVVFGLAHGMKNQEQYIHLLGRKADLSNATHVEILTGHLHGRGKSVKIITEKHGVIYRYLPSLTGADKWHEDGLFIGNGKYAQVLFFDEKKPLCEYFIG